MNDPLCKETRGIKDRMLLWIEIPIIAPEMCGKMIDVFSSPRCVRVKNNIAFHNMSLGHKNNFLKEHTFSIYHYFINI